MKGLFGSFLWTQWALNFKFWQNALEWRVSRDFWCFFLRVQWALMANFGKIYWSLEKWKFKCLLEVMGTVGFKVQILAKCIGVYREFQGIFGGV